MNPFFRYRSSRQRNDPQHDAQRVRLRPWCLFALMMFSCVVIANPDQRAPYTIRMCAAPVDLTLHGVPVDDSSVPSICASPAPAQPLRIPLYDAHAKSSASGSPFLWAHLIVSAHGDRLDVRLQSGKTVRYEARHVPFDAEHIVLHSESPGDALRPTISTRRLRKLHYISIHVLNAKASRVAHDLRRLGKLNIQGLNNITDAKVTIKFQAISVFSTLQLLAMVSSRDGAHQALLVKHNRQDRYIIGRNRNLPTILELENKLPVDDRARTIAMLQRIIALAKPTAPGEIAVPVANELRRLSDMAFADRDLAHAIALDRLRLTELGTRYHGDEDADYGIALADLADAQLQQHDFKDAQAMTTLLRAVAIMQRHPGDDMLPHIAGA